MAVPTTAPLTSLTAPANRLSTSIWLAAGFFGLLGGALLMLFSDPLTDRIVWLAETTASVPCRYQRAE